MKNLMKYELRKTLATKLIILGITAAVEILFLAGLYLNKENLAGIAVFILIALTVGGISFIGLQSVLTLHRDMNTKQSYMLFMTPNSSYKILGAKVIENGLSILIAGGFFFALGMLDIGLAFARYGELGDMWHFFEEMIHTLNQNIQINAQSMACLAFGILASWIATLTMAYLADVVSAALLNGKKHNGVVSFLLFLALSFLLGFIQDQFGSAAQINMTFIIHGCIALVFAVIMYLATAHIMETKLSV